MSSSRTAASTALRRLTTEYRQLSASASSSLSQGTAAVKDEVMFLAGPAKEEDFFVWECLIKGPSETPYEGGIFLATLEFTKEYPLMPPKMKFVPPLIHPNVYKGGEVCISILHPPGDDPNMYESSSERWSPVQSVEKILLSVVSMLAEPNVESGANIDVCKLLRLDPKGYDRLVRTQVRQLLGLPPPSQQLSPSSSSSQPSSSTSLASQSKLSSQSEISPSAVV